MGFERVEDPSQVEDSVLVGLGKAQSSRASFAVGKRARIPPKEPSHGFRKGRRPFRFPLFRPLVFSLLIPYNTLITSRRRPLCAFWILILISSLLIAAR